MKLKTLFTSGAIVALGVLLGRFSGFAREISLAITFGLNQSADIAVAMLTLPDVFINLLIGGSFAAALVPAFKRLNGTDRAALFFQSTLMTLLVFSGCAVGLMLLAPAWLPLLAPGLPTAKLLPYFDTILWILPLSAAAGVSTAYLQSQGKFLVPAFGTLIFNLVLIIALCVSHNIQSALLALEFGIIVGALLRWASQLACTRLRVRGPWLMDRALVHRYFQAMIASGLLFLLPPIGAAIASTYGEGQMAAFNYANKLVQLPLGVALSIFSVVLLPKFSEQFAEKQKLQAIQLARQSLLLITALSFILLGIGMLAMPDIVKLVYGRGNFSPEQLAYITRLSVVMLLSLPAQGISSLLMSLYNAYQDTWTPFYISNVAASGFLFCSLFIMFNFSVLVLVGCFSVIYWGIAWAQIKRLATLHRMVMWSPSLQKALWELLLLIVLGLAITCICYRMLPKTTAWHLLISGVGLIGLLSVACRSVLKGKLWNAEANVNHQSTRNRDLRVKARGEPDFR